MQIGQNASEICKYNKIYAKCHLLYKHYVSFAFCHNCIMSPLLFVLLAFCLICILLHLHFVSFAFYYICILSNLHFVTTELCLICPFKEFNFVSFTFWYFFICQVCTLSILTLFTFAFCQIWILLWIHLKTLWKDKQDHFAALWVLCISWTRAIIWHYAIHIENLMDITKVGWNEISY